MIQICPEGVREVQEWECGTTFWLCDTCRRRIAVAAKCQPFCPVCAKRNLQNAEDDLRKANEVGRG